MLKEDNVRAGFFMPEQFESVRAHLPAHLKNVATVAYVTGWRTRSEILPLEWRQVDLEAGELRLDAGTTKNGDARTFPMTLELRRALEAQQAEANRLKGEGIIARFVFTKRNGTPIRSFRKAWASACMDAGCPGRILHDFRRTSVRNLVRAGIPARGDAVDWTQHPVGVRALPHRECGRPEGRGAEARRCGTGTEGTMSHHRPRSSWVHSGYP
jgi:integrase